jgi:L-lactate permease
MEALLWNLALCLFVLFMPIVLFIYTLLYVSQEESHTAAGLLVLLNIFLALAIISTVAQKQLPTLTVTAISGYMLVVATYVCVRGIILCTRIWNRVQARLANRRFQYVDEEIAALQSTLRY